MNILKYFLLLMTVIFSYAAFAQNEHSTDTVKHDFEITPFIRLGIDVSAIGRSFYEPEVRQIEFSVDSELIRNFFFNLEGGVLRVNSEQETFSYKSSGYFVRAGTDFNLLGRPDPGQKDLVLFGLRYAYAYLNHESPFFDLENPYWGSYSGSIDPSGYHAHWFELTGGVRTEVFKNLFVGWTLRTKVPLYKTAEPEIEPYYIAGLGYGKLKTPVMVHFSLFYRFGL